MLICSCHLLDDSHPNRLLDRLRAGRPSPKNKDGRERGRVELGIEEHLTGYSKMTVNTNFLPQTMADRY